MFAFQCNKVTYRDRREMKLINKRTFSLKTVLTSTFFFFVGLIWVFLERCYLFCVISLCPCAF